MRIRKYGIIFLVSFLSFFWIGSAEAADVAKIGIVDLQRAVSTSDYGKSAQAEIKKERDKMLQELQEKGAEIEALGKQLERESMVMSNQKREEKEREFRIKQNDFRLLSKKNNQKMQDLQKGLFNTVVKDVFALAEEIGKKEGYLLIIRSESVMYSPDSIDITDQIIKQLNDSHVKKSGN
jgi:outer membrane protein